MISNKWKNVQFGDAYETPAGKYPAEALDCFDRVGDAESLRHIIFIRQSSTSGRRSDENDNRKQQVCVFFLSHTHSLIPALTSMRSLTENQRDQHLSENIQQTAQRRIRLQNLLALDGRRSVCGIRFHSSDQIHARQIREEKREISIDAAGTAFRH